MKSRAIIACVITLLFIQPTAFASQQINDKGIKGLAELIIPSAGELAHQSTRCNIYYDMNTEVYALIVDVARNVPEKIRLTAIYENARQNGNDALYNSGNLYTKYTTKAAVHLCNESGKKFIRDLTSTISGAISQYRAKF